MESFNSKVLLFGEYSALYNSMALVMPYDRFSGQLTFATGDHHNKYAYRSNEYLKKFSTFIASHVDENFVLEVKQFEWEINNGLFFQSNIPQGYGLGSSGALVVAIFLRYLKKAKELKDELKGLTLETAQKLKMSLGQMESFFHGTSSGLDPLSIILNKPILYKSAAHVAPVQIPAKNEAGENVIFLLNTGIERQTAIMMSEFRRLSSDIFFKRKIQDHLVNYTNESIQSFLNDKPSCFYENLDQLIQFQLKEMKFFIPPTFQKVISKGLDNGDYFLKLCGAGGGGFMLGFTKDWDLTREKLKEYDLEMIYRY
jgi:mevalonate kinase